MVGVAVVGAGSWGKHLARHFAGLPCATWRYICDLDVKVQHAMASLYPWVTITDDLQTVLADPEVHAVVVAVDVPLHYRLAKAAIEAGKHTYVEKPLTLSSGEDHKLLKLADARGVKLR